MSDDNKGAPATQNTDQQALGNRLASLKNLYDKNAALLNGLTPAALPNLVPSGPYPSGKDGDYLRALHNAGIETARDALPDLKGILDTAIKRVNDPNFNKDAAKALDAYKEIEGKLDPGSNPYADHTKDVDRVADAADKFITDKEVRKGADLLAPGPMADLRAHVAHDLADYINKTGSSKEKKVSPQEVLTHFFGDDDPAILKASEVDLKRLEHKPSSVNPKKLHADTGEQKENPATTSLATRDNNDIQKTSITPAKAVQAGNASGNNPAAGAVAHVVAQDQLKAESPPQYAVANANVPARPKADIPAGPANGPQIA